MIEGQIGVLKVRVPIPLIQKKSTMDGTAIHRMILKPGVYPLRFDPMEMGEEVFAGVGFSTESVTLEDGRKPTSKYGIPDSGFTIIRWSQQEVAASEMQKWMFGRGHPIWEFALDMAAARPDWKYHAEIMHVNEEDEEIVEYHEAIIRPPV